MHLEIRIQEATYIWVFSRLYNNKKLTPEVFRCLKAKREAQLMYSEVKKQQISYKQGM